MTIHIETEKSYRWPATHAEHSLDALVAMDNGYNGRLSPSTSFLSLPLLSLLRGRGTIVLGLGHLDAFGIGRQSHEDCGADVVDFGLWL